MGHVSCRGLGAAPGSCPLGVSAVVDGPAWMKRARKITGTKLSYLVESSAHNENNNSHEGVIYYSYLERRGLIAVMVGQTSCIPLSPFNALILDFYGIMLMTRALDFGFWTMLSKVAFTCMNHSMKKYDEGARYRRNEHKCNYLCWRVRVSL